MKHLLFLDIETTGLSAQKDELIELSAIRVSTDFQKDIALFDELVKPNQEISPFITRLTGISNEMVRTAKTVDEIHEDFKKFLKPNDIICGHNIMFDIGFLREKGFAIENEHLDTFPLSNILLPNEPSYSLEILTKRFEIEHENAHRALADVRANLELFKELVNIAHHLDEKLQYKYKELLQKSEWTGKILFDAAFTENKTDEKWHEESQVSLFDVDSSLSAEEKSKVINTNITLVEQCVINAIEEEFASSEKQVLLSLPAEAQEMTAATIAAKKIEETNEKEKICVAVCGFENSTPKGFFRFSSPEKVVCERAFEYWKERRNIFSETEVVAAMKYEREKFLGNSLIVHDLPMMRDEWSIAKKWTSDNHVRCTSDCPAKKMQLEALQKHLFFCHVSDIGNCPATKGIVVQSQNLAKSLEKASHKTLAIRSIKKALEGKKDQSITRDIFFGIGLLERLVREEVGESPYREYFVIRPDLQKRTEVKNLVAGFLEAKRQCALHFPDDKGLQEDLGTLAKFLSEPIQENTCRFLTIFQDDNIFLHSSDISLLPRFEKNFSEKEKIIFTGKAFLERGGRKLFGEMLSTPEKQREIKTHFDFQKNALFCIPSFGGNGKTADSKKTTEIIEKILPQCTGNLLALFPGGTIAENFSTAIEKAAEENGFQVLGIHGSAGKLAEKMKGRKSIVVATSGNWKKIDFSSANFVGCVQHRLIFDPPDDPAGKIRNKNISDSFLDIALPKAVQKAVLLLDGLSSTKHSFFWLCLDAHFQKSGNFTEEILAALPPSLPIQKMEVNTMPEAVKNFMR